MNRFIPVFFEEIEVECRRKGMAGSRQAVAALAGVKAGAAELDFSLKKLNVVVYHPDQWTRSTQG